MTDSVPSSGNPSPLGGLVLAGGSGTRFGRPKATISLGGRSLVGRAVDALQPHCDPVIVVTRSDTALPADLTARVVFDPHGPAAALAALAGGLAALDNDDVLVLACDLVVEADVVERLVAMPRGSAVAVSAGAILQPLCARYPRLAAIRVAEALVAGGDLRVSGFASSMDADVISVAASSCQNLNQWVDAFAVALGVPVLSHAMVEDVLDLTRIVAHGTERKNGPIGSYLAGYAAGAAGGDPRAALSAAIAAATELIGPPPPDPERPVAGF